MNTRNTAVRLAVLAGSVALVTAGCASGGAASESTGSADGDVTLTVATFNDFGYTDELLAEYEEANPGVTIVHNVAATSNDARANYFQKLGQTGLADIEAVEVDWMPEVMEYADLLAPVPEDLSGRWLDWKEEAATDASGNLVAYGTDIGPEGVCYRSDLFAAAGLPTDREAVAELLTGDWEAYFAAGQQYTAASGKAWYDSAMATWQGMINQVQNAYEEDDGAIIATENAEVKAIYDTVTEQSATLSAKLSQWSDDWFAGLAAGDFATMLCPGWMLGVIEGNAPDATGWDIANVFPGGGGNWGGSYLTVPANGANVEEAQKLADWLTAPEQQVKAFANAGTFPSQVDSYEDPTLVDATNPYFTDAPTGSILIERAEAVDVAPFKGASYFQINDLMREALDRVEAGTDDAQASWDKWVSEVDAIG